MKIMLHNKNSLGEFLAAKHSTTTWPTFMLFTKVSSPSSV
jgi:hypothetical protein